MTTTDTPPCGCPPCECCDLPDNGCMNEPCPWDCTPERNAQRVAAWTRVTAQETTK